MIGELDAIRLALVTEGWPTFYVDAPTHPDTFPYLVLASSSGRMYGPALCADLTDLDDLVRVMAVALTPESVVVTQERVRAVLHNTHPPVDGRSVTVRLFGSEPVAVDRDMTVTPTNLHPAYGVDLYRLTSVPLPPPPIPVVPVTGAQQGTPGSWEPANAYPLPTTVAEANALGLALGAKWAPGTWVPLADPGASHTHWAGPVTKFAPGDAPVPPSITAITPNTGPTAGGTAITLTGTGFSGATELIIGGYGAPFVIVNATTITATTPPNTAGGKAVVLVTTAGNASVAGGFTYLAPPDPTVPPNIFDIAPNTGPTTGGTPFTLSGLTFIGANLLTIGGVTVEDMAVINDSTITGTTPANTAGPRNVALRNAAGTAFLWDGFTYTEAGEVIQ